MQPQTGKIREAIDCCRPGSDDVRAPEMAFLAEAIDDDPNVRDAFEQSQRLDAHLGRVFGEVPIPEGLEDRLSAALAREGDESASATTSPNAAGDATAAAGRDTEAAERPLPASSSRRPPRAHLFRYAAAGVVAAVLLVGVTVGVVMHLMSRDGDVPRQQFLAAASDAVEMALDRGQWNSDLTAAPTEHAFPSRTVIKEPIAWQLAPSVLDRPAVAYQLSGRIGSEEVLLSADSPQPVIGLTPVPAPMPASGEQSKLAWQADNKVFLLVVRGPGHARRYQQLLKEQGTLARLPRKVSPVSLFGKT